MQPWQGSCTRFLHYDDNIGLWQTLNPRTHARLNWMSSAPPVSLFQLPRLTECLYSMPTAVTNLCMPGMYGTQDAQACKLPGWLGWSEQVLEMEWSLGTSNVAQCANQDRCSPLLLPVDFTYVSLMCQHLDRDISQLQTRTKKKRKLDWPRAILPDALLQHARLSITSMCSTASALPHLCLLLMRRDTHWANAN